MEERQHSTAIWTAVLVLAIILVLLLRLEQFQTQREAFDRNIPAPVPTLMATPTLGLPVFTPQPYAPPTPVATAFVVAPNNSGSITVNQNTTNVNVDFCLGYCP